MLLCANEELEIDPKYEESDLRRLLIKKERALMEEMKHCIESVKRRHKNTLEVYTSQKTQVISYLEKINKIDMKTIRIIIGIEIVLEGRE